MKNDQLVVKRLAILSALYASICVPAILLAERFNLPEWPMHTTQPLAIVILLVSGSYYLYQTRRGEPSWFRKSLYFLCGAAVVWICLIIAFIVASVFLPSGPDGY